MALVAGVRHADCFGQVRPRHPETVVAPFMDDHVGLGRHVAVHALRAGAVGLVVMVLGHIEFRRQMTLRAQRVALGSQGEAVRRVAVRAGDSARSMRL